MTYSPPQGPTSEMITLGVRISAYGFLRTQSFSSLHRLLSVPHTAPRLALSTGGILRADGVPVQAELFLCLF